MDNFSTINSLSQLSSEKNRLRKRVRRQENQVLDDLYSVQAGAKKWVDGVFRISNIVKFFLPKIEFATVLFPVLKRIIRKRRR